MAERSGFTDLNLGMSGFSVVGEHLEENSNSNAIPSESPSQIWAPTPESNAQEQKEAKARLWSDEEIQKDNNSGAEDLMIFPSEAQINLKKILEETGISTRLSSYESDGTFTAIANAELARFGPDSVKPECLLSPPATPAAAPVANQATVAEATGSSPCMRDFPGELGFDARVATPIKSKDAQFSDITKKIYLDQKRTLKLFFNVRPSETDHQMSFLGLKIRALPVFVRPDHFREPVKVCPEHSTNTGTGKLRTPNSGHLIHSTNDETTYEVDEKSSRQSVVVQIPPVQPGSSEVDLTYRFTDLSSCPGGLNRRDIAVIFTLECQNLVIGRKVIGVRICTCPRRDMKTEEEKFSAAKKFEQEANATLPPPGKRPLKSPKVKTGGGVGDDNNGRGFWVLARTRENFDALRTMGECLEQKDRRDPAAYQRDVALFNAGLVSPPKKIKSEK